VFYPNGKLQLIKLFGLMIDAERLVAIRSERKANSRYASFSQCQMELSELLILLVTGYHLNLLQLMDSLQHEYRIEEISK
jgi:regulator of PEP synthase PpsR (kinase-PPPase family)